MEIGSGTMGGTVDVRVKYLEQVTKQLAEQVRVMKQLVTAEVADLKGVMQQQVTEIKQIVMAQDRVYQERMRRMESRVEQLSEFSMHLARSTGTSGSLRNVPLSMLGGEEGGSPGNAGGASPARNDDDDDEDAPQGVEGIVAKYKDKLDAIYTFYTTSNINVFHPAMTIAHFTRLCKDCNLCSFQEAGTPAELLWMAVIRKLGKKRARRAPKPSGSVTSINQGKFPKDKKGNFAFERLQEIPREAFPDAMYYLSVERLGQHRADLPPEHMFETFLVTEVFPNVDDRMQFLRSAAAAGSAAAAMTSASMMPKDLSAASDVTIQDYKTEPVKAVVKEYYPQIRESFTECVKWQNYSDSTMNLDGFVEFARRHDLLPLIAKPDLRQIFMACTAIQRAQHKEGVKSDTLQLPALITGLYHLADRIYSDRLFADKYPTPESRVRKLLAKMFLLR